MRGKINKSIAENSSRGFVKTPRGLVDEMISKIPREMFESSTTTFLDPCCGRGIFLYAVAKELASFGHSKENICSRLVGVDRNPAYVNTAKRSLEHHGYGDIIVKRADALSYNFDMKFNVVIGNPPYQHTTGSSAGKPIWHLFVDVALNVCKDGGYVSLIHPFGWRNGKSKFKSISKRLREYQIDHCVLSNYDTGIKYFRVNTTCDQYVLHKVASYKASTLIDYDGEINTINLKNAAQIPNSIPAQYVDCIDLTMTNTVSINGDTTYHTQKDIVQRTEDDIYKYPVVYTLKQSGPSFWYARDNTHHFGIPKILMGRGLGQPVLDLKGEMAPCEFSYYITAEDTDILEKMYNALCNPECIKLCKQLGSGKGHNYLKEAVGLLHKDFWKRFQQK